MDAAKCGDFCKIFAKLGKQLGKLRQPDTPDPNCA